MKSIISENFDLIQTRVTDGVAVGAVSSPFWLTPLEGVSSLAGSLLPILGCAWLIVQIVGYYRPKRKGKD